MSKVVIVRYVDFDLITEPGALLIGDRMVSALKKAIAPDVAVESITSGELKIALSSPTEAKVLLEEVIWCPLTIDIPQTLSFPAQKVFTACSDRLGLRKWVKQQGYKTYDEAGFGNLYLPIVLTAKGAIYGEAIAEGATAVDFQRMPVHLPDKDRQPLYHLAHQLLQYISATPAVYLLQFGYNEKQDIIFDKLWPFPAAPAIASIGVQEPDLFACHWLCLTGQPIHDLTITPTS